jgi:hypothetical protein
MAHSARPVTRGPKRRGLRGVGAFLSVLMVAGAFAAPLVVAGPAGAAGSTPTSVSLASSAPTAPAGSVTFTATVTPSAATGTVTFFDGSSPIGTASVSAGSATFTTITLMIRDHNIKASYGGDATYAASTSAVILQHITATVDCSAGTIVHVAPPTDAGDGQFLDPAVIQEFDEQRDFLLTAGRPVDFAQPGTHYQLSDLPSPAPVIPSGTLVRSHMIHADHTGTQDASYSGCFTFDRDVLGIELQNNSPSTFRLDASDFLGSPTTTYEPAGNTQRGIDFGQVLDIVSLLPDRRTVEVHFDINSVMDEIRVITQGSNVEVATAGAGGGRVVSSPAGIDCGATCYASFATGTAVTLTATPDATSTFTGWSGACSGTANCVVTAGSPVSVVATFAKLTYPVSVVTAGSGGGGVVSSPAGIDCGATCTTSFDAGTDLTLTASPDATSTFAGWSGDCSGTGDCVLTVDGPMSATATFT